MNRTVLSDIEELSGWRRNRLPIYIFLVMCANLLVAPAVYGATGELTRKAAYALGLLGLVTLGLAVYLFTVIFQLERF